MDYDSGTRLVLVLHTSLSRSAVGCRNSLEEAKLHIEDQVRHIDEVANPISPIDASKQVHAVPLLRRVVGHFWMSDSQLAHYYCSLAHFLSSNDVYDGATSTGMASLFPYKCSQASTFREDTVS